VHRLFLICLIFLISCNYSKGGITIAGSTSIQPFIEKVAEKFTEGHPEIRINVQGGGSTAGVQATLNKTCDIGMSSRYLKPEEQGLHTVLIAQDGIAIIVHRDNSVENLTLPQVRDIFSGKITNWQELGGTNEQIITVTREEGSGTRAAFERLIMGEATISDACLVQDSNGAVREIIATTHPGIGYISVELVDEREKAIGIDGIKPTRKNITSGRYKIVRPFLLLLRTKPAGNIKVFIDYILSDEGQGIFEKEGLLCAGRSR